MLLLKGEKILKRAIELRFIEQTKKNLQGYTLIEGFPGLGLAGTIAAKYLIERLKMKEIGVFDANIFMPVIRIHEGQPVHPSRIYVDEKLKIALLISEQIIPKNYTIEVADKIVEWIKEKKFKRIISLSGIQLNEETEDIYGIGCNSESIKVLQKYGVKVIEDGITTGITALILLKLTDYKIEGFSLMGVVQLGADYKAAASLIKKLNDILGLAIKIEPLLKEAQDTEKALLSQLEKLKKTQQELTKFEDTHSMMTT